MPASTPLSRPWGNQKSEFKVIPITSHRTLCCSVVASRDLLISSHCRDNTSRAHYSPDCSTADRYHNGSEEGHVMVCYWYAFVRFCYLEVECLVVSWEADRSFDNDFDDDLDGLALESDVPKQAESMLPPYTVLAWDIAGDNRSARSPGYWRSAVDHMERERLEQKAEWGVMRLKTRCSSYCSFLIRDVVRCW